jgi:predicted flap endonuclease-1-like 5' DNA nuclease
MGLIERIKSALGLGTSTSSAGSTSSADRRADTESAGGAEPTPVSDIEGDEDVEVAQTVVDPGDRGDDDVDVTVEHEPDTRSEDAVKGTDTAGTGTSADVEPAEESVSDGTDEPSAGDTDTEAGTDADTVAAADLEELRGIGPAYAGRLRDAGIEDVADLAAADAAALAERSDISEGRLQTFIDRAAER